MKRKVLAALCGILAASAVQMPVLAEEMPTVVMGFMNWTGTPKDIDRVEAAASAYTEEKIGVKLELMILDSATYEQNCNLMLASGEPLDLFNTIYLGYQNCINKGYCLDLEEDDLIQTYGQGIYEAIDQAYIDGSRVNGILYGLPQNRDLAYGTGGFDIGKEYLDAIGFDYEAIDEDPDKEFIQTDLDHITEIFAQLHEAFPEKTVFVPNSNQLEFILAADTLSGQEYFGALMDPANSLEVSDIFESDFYLDWCKHAYDWNQKGYISSDALTTTESDVAQVRAGNTMAKATKLKPGAQIQESESFAEGCIVFQTGEDFMPTSTFAQMPWCINSRTEDPVASMKMLNLFYTDGYLMNLVNFGEEGVDYVLTDDTHITFAEGQSLTDFNYHNDVGWLLPNQFIGYIWGEFPSDYWDQLTVFNQSAIKSKALGFAFDGSEYSTEVTAMTNIFNEYNDALIYGFSDPETTIPEFVEKLKDAGLDEYIAAKQEQLNAWSELTGVE